MLNLLSISHHPLGEATCDTGEPKLPDLYDMDESRTVPEKHQICKAYQSAANESCLALNPGVMLIWSDGPTL